MRIFHTLCLGLVAYYYLAQVFFSPLDQSPFSVSIPSTPYINLTGELGAMISGYLRFYFGLSSNLLGIPLLLSAVYGLARQTKENFRRTTSRLLGSCLAVITVSLMIYLVLPILDEYNPASQYVGNLGEQLWSSTKLLIGEAGLATLSLVGMASTYYLSLQSRKTYSVVKDKNDKGDDNASLAQP